jgi:protocatechuate 3,4-dioxygenase beta subunit
MERKIFLKSSVSALGLAFVVPLFKSCAKEKAAGATSTSSGTDSGSCEVTPTETAGPFPTITPSSLVSANIVSDRKGVPLTIKLTVNNSSKGCAALSGAIADVWHCDAAGNYSEYGGGGMQSTDYTSVHFLRGRQTTNASGLVTFTSIFPGWYSGRAPHIHVHVYGVDGTSLMITQIAFPTDICNTVYTTATDYKSRGTQDTSNSTDNVFSDSLASELATVSGTITDGYILTHIITVSA